MEPVDFIIAGGGTAGCVLANRLTEDPSVTVLLLEAGGDDRRLEVRAPAAFSKLFKTDADWAYETLPEPRLKDRRLFWPRGKVLGGCSSINAMIYIRGHAWDYDHWASLDNDGWSYRDVLPYFKRAECWHGQASPDHGYGGPLHVGRMRRVTPMSEIFLRAATETGLALNPDFNGPTQDGVGIYHTNIHGGRRWSVVDGYLRPALRRPNLQVVTNAQATRLIFDGRRATGVEYLRGGKLTRAMALREVLVCGGAIGSPHLLLLSGVGPAAQLRAREIPIVIDLPGVGENLQDHLMGMLVYGCKERGMTLDHADTLGNVARYLLLKQGPFLSNVGEAGAFLRTREGLPAPDLQIIFAPGYFVRHGFVKPEGDGFSMGFILLRPESRGRVSLSRGMPGGAPNIEANYLESAADEQVLLEGLKFCRNLAHAPAFSHYRGAEYVPGTTTGDEAFLREYIREWTETVYHPVGTCMMGRGPRAVVDSRLRVRGLDGVRVVDASIMPTIVGGNTHAPVIMIAEKAADMIKAAYR